MNMGIRWLPGLLFLAVLAGCGGGDEREAAPGKRTGAESVLVRGHYAFGHEVRALRPCGEEDDVWVIDPSGILQKAHGDLVGSLAGAPRVFVAAIGRTGPAPADGFGAEYAGSVTLEEIIYVAGEGHDCDFDLTRFVFRANGNEPFWMVEVLPDGMTLSWPGSPTLTWPEVSREESGSGLVFLGSGADDQGRLTIISKPGYDSMSGAYHSQTAVFELGGKKFEGVAIRGFAGD